jgi:hypothetical protein
VGPIADLDRTIFSGVDSADFGVGLVGLGFGSISSKSYHVAHEATSFDTGISAIFIPYDEPFDAITLDVDEIGIDEVGTFPASLTFSHQDDRTFQSDDCEVSIETHEPDGEDTESGVSYCVRGSGTCASPAASLDDSGETLTISEFKFAAGVIWDQ